MADVYEGHTISKTGVTDKIDQARAEAAVRELLAAIGEDPDREGLLETPARVARMYAELLYGMYEEPQAHLLKQFHESNHEEMVIVKDIPFSSMCEHHLLPFVGVAHVAYIPRQGKVTGLSKVARVVEGFSHRLQLQERLTSQIADAFVEMLDVPWRAGRRRGRAHVHDDSRYQEARLHHSDVCCSRVDEDRHQDA